MGRLPEVLAINHSDGIKAAGSEGLFYDLQEEGAGQEGAEGAEGAGPNGKKLLFDQQSEWPSQSRTRSTCLSPSADNSLSNSVFQNGEQNNLHVMQTCGPVV